jgi:acyl-CoA synthetase (AMP-forming)/AMP-acid ligase II
VIRLIRLLGVRRGEFVAVVGENSCSYVQVMLAAIWGGQVLVPMSLHLGDDHFRHILKVRDQVPKYCYCALR